MRLWTKTIDVNFFSVRKQLKHFVIYHAQTRDTCREMKVWSNVRSLSRSRRLSRSKQKIVWPSCWTKKAERMIALNERERGQGRSKESEWYRHYIAKGLNWKRKGRNSKVVQEVLSIIFIQIITWKKGGNYRVEWERDGRGVSVQIAKTTTIKKTGAVRGDTNLILS